MADETITLTPEQSERVRRIMEEHAYRSPVDVIDGSLRALDRENNPELEPWMIEAAEEALEQMERDPSSIRTMEQVDAHLKGVFEELYAEEQAEALRKAS